MDGAPRRRRLRRARRQGRGDARAAAPGPPALRRRHLRRRRRGPVRVRGQDGAPDGAARALRAWVADAPCHALLLPPARPHRRCDAPAQLRGRPARGHGRCVLLHLSLRVPGFFICQCSVVAFSCQRLDF